MIRTLLAGLLLTAWTPPAGAEPACGGGGLLSDFEANDVIAGFAQAQLQRGSIDLVQDPELPENQAAKLMAGRKRGGQVGKAGLIHRFPPVPVGTVIEMGARILVPEGSFTDSVILMDLECASCGLETNPGIRLYLRDGRLRIDRSKIGIAEPFYSGRDIALEAGAWHDVVWRVEVGEDQDGRSTILLDGSPLSDERGTTVLTQTVVSRLANIQVREEVDRFQVGLTANSNGTETSLLVDDVRFCLR